METVIDATARALARDLDQRLGHILEPAMQRTLVREALLDADPQVGCSLLAYVVGHTRRSGGCPPDALSDALHYLLLAGETEQGVPHERRVRLYALAVEAGHEAVGTMLRRSGACRLPEPTPPKELSDLPLGVRRSHARGSDPRVLELLAQDHDRVVLDHWLANPRVVEAEVVRLAASRPVARVALQAIFESDKWSIRSSVRVALAHNPYSPPDLAASVVASLPLPDLRAMRGRPDLDEVVCQRLELELSRRDPKAAVA